MLQIEKTVQDGVAEFILEGRLDTVTAPELNDAIQEVLPDLTALRLDFEKLEYISSAGLRVLLASQKVMSKQGEMKIVNVNDTIMEIFEVTGFSEILTID